MIRTVHLSDNGGDRATGYVMSNKIVRLGNSLLCTWLGNLRQNYWALVDVPSGQICEMGSLGGAVADNHCGAAIAVDSRGTCHAVIGGHHTLMRYYQFANDGSAQWQEVDWLNVGGTYPSLVCDQEDVLHLAYRCKKSDFWTLNYCRRVPGSSWSNPRSLVQHNDAGYVYWTNGLVLGPKGWLHLIFANRRTIAEKDTYNGASHLYSRDGGDTWIQYSSATPIQTPARAAGLSRIEAEELDPARMHPADLAVSHEDPLHRAFRQRLDPVYYQMLLSNPVIGEEEDPWVVVHNRLHGSASLYHAASEGWTRYPLLSAVRDLFPDYDIHSQSALGRHADGTLEIALMVVPPGCPGWGPPETELVQVLMDPRDGALRTRPIGDPDTDACNWLPNIQQWDWRNPFASPALLYTHGNNGAALCSNVNNLCTDVWLRMP